MHRIDIHNICEYPRIRKLQEKNNVKVNRYVYRPGTLDAVRDVSVIPGGIWVLNHCLKSTALGPGMCWTRLKVS